MKNTYGITFGWAKAMEGTCTNGCGGVNWHAFVVGAKAAGIVFGPYHYARYDQDIGTNGAVTEAHAFWNAVKDNVKADGLSLMPMLDIEASDGGQPANLATNTPANLSLWIDTWCTTLTNDAWASGLVLKPCIYASSSFTATWFTSTLTKWNNDIAAYKYTDSGCSTCPGLNYNNGQTSAPAHVPWANWNFWQYDDENQGESLTDGDGDVFNGTLAQLTNTMVVIAAGPQITLQPVSQTVTNGASITMTVAATGSGTVHYQWRFNGTNIATATTTSYTDTNVQNTDAGCYNVVVTDSVTNTVSANAYIAVITKLTNGPASVVSPAGLVDWWPGDANAIDIFATNNGTLNGTTSYSSGEIGQGFQFDGSTSYITTGLSSIPVPWTACMWVNRQNSPATSAALLSDGTNSIKLEQYNGTRNLGITRENVSDNLFSPATSVPTNVWTHLAFVGTSTGTVVYVNGVLTASITNILSLPRAYFGATFNASSPLLYVDHMLGSMDELMLYNTALTAPQISTIASAGTSGVMKASMVIAAGTTNINGTNFFYATVQGQTGKNFTAYTSSDMRTWATVAAAVTNINGTGTYLDTGYANRTRRFIRVSQPY